MLHPVKSFFLQREKIFEMICIEMQENVGEYLPKLIEIEIIKNLWREYYEHGKGELIIGRLLHYSFRSFSHSFRRSVISFFISRLSTPIINITE